MHCILGSFARFLGLLRLFESLAEHFYAEKGHKIQITHSCTSHHNKFAILKMENSFRRKAKQKQQQTFCPRKKGRVEYSNYSVYEKSTSLNKFLRSDNLYIFSAFSPSAILMCTMPFEDQLECISLDLYRFLAWKDSV